MPARNPDSIAAIFSKNLRFYSDTKPSIAHICREMKLNRPQYNRYLAGETLPNPRSMKRIADYFGVKEIRFFEISQVKKALNLSNSRAVKLEKFENAVSGSRSSLATGAYYIYLCNPAAKGFFIRGIIIVKREANLTVFTRYGNDRTRSTRSKHVFRDQYDGIVTDNGGITTFTGASKSNNSMICTMIIKTLFEGQAKIFSGLSLSVQSTGPVAFQFILEFIGDIVNPALLAKKCGVFSSKSEQIDSTIGNFLATSEENRTVLRLYSRLDAGSFTLQDYLI